MAEADNGLNGGDDAGWWDCSLCTYRNSAEKFKCEICDLRRGTSTRKPRCSADTIVAQVVKQQEQIRQQTKAKPSPKSKSSGSQAAVLNSEGPATPTVGTSGKQTTTLKKSKSSQNDSKRRESSGVAYDISVSEDDDDDDEEYEAARKRSKKRKKKPTASSRSSKKAKRSNSNHNNSVSNNSNDQGEDEEDEDTDTEDSGDEFVTTRKTNQREQLPKSNDTDESTSTSYDRDSEVDRSSAFTSPDLMTYEQYHSRLSPQSPSYGTPSKSYQEHGKEQDNPFKANPVEINGNLIKYLPPASTGRTGLIIDKKRFTQHSVTVDDVTITFTEFATRQNNYVRKKKKRTGKAAIPPTSSSIKAESNVAASNNSASAPTTDHIVEQHSKRTYSQTTCAKPET